MENVKESLRTLIQGESDAVALYSQFMEKARQESFWNIATLFEALIMAEKVHIKNHYNALGEDFVPEVRTFEKSNSTKENLEIALKGEDQESRKLYPKLIKNIKKESKTEYGKVAKLSMTWAKVVEKEHAKLLRIAYKNLIKNKSFDFNTISVCQVCGNIVINKKNDSVCQVCGHDDIFFKAISKVSK